MTKGELTKLNIIKTSAELFLQNGYCNTGLSTILESCSIPKGSFYFHFKSKTDLGIAVAKYFGDGYSEWFNSILSRTDTWHSFIDSLINDIKVQINDGTYYGCPFSCFGTETAVISDKISKVCSQSINGFGMIFAKALYRKNLPSRTEISRGYAALSMYEGYLVCYRITHNKAVIDQMGNSLKEME